MIQSVDRAIRVLTALQGARRMSLSELAARLELAPSTTHGIVRTLVEHGMVVQERGSSRYQLGPAVLRLGNVYLDTLELRSKTIPWAEDLARRTGLRRAHRGAADRRRRDHPPRAAPRRQPADARGRHRHPGPRQRARQGHARVPARGREARPHLGRAAQHDRRDAHRPPTTCARSWTRCGPAASPPSRTRPCIGESALASPVFDSSGEAVGAIGVVIPSGGELGEPRGPRRRPRDGARPLPRARRPGLAPAPAHQLAQRTPRATFVGDTLAWVQGVAGATPDL